MKHTFLTAQPLVPGRRYRLDRHEAVLASHLKARRIRVGEKLQFVNNSGSVFDAQCVSIGDWEFEITGSRVVPRALPLIELYLAPPKGDALTECLQQATECGVSSISFVSSEFCQVSHKDAPPFERAERVVASSQAQCVQPFEVRVSPLWHSVQEVSLQDQAHWCDERLSEHPKIVVGSQTTPSESLQLWIGPEGGWSESERQIFDKHAKAIGLGPLILRTPTAIVAAVQTIRLLAQMKNG